MKTLFHKYVLIPVFSPPSPPTSSPYLYPPNFMPSFPLSLQKQIGK